MTQFHLKPRTTRQPQDTIDGHTRPSTRLVDGHTRLVTIDWRLSCVGGPKRQAILGSGSQLYLGTSYPFRHSPCSRSYGLDYVSHTRQTIQNT